jgi:distribution and morphology protein 12
MHLRVEHAADLSLTLFTSLQVNYPSALFMSLPLKLVITGLTLAADVVIAYSSRKNRVHITIVDTGDDGTSAEKHDHNAPYGYGHHQPVTPGQRILPHLHIESEIGHADAHVLRNVGKVERFIVDVVRKTLVDELVFPNFHTIALP